VAPDPIVGGHMCDLRVTFEFRRERNKQACVKSLDLRIIIGRVFFKLHLGAETPKHSSHDVLPIEMVDEVGSAEMATEALASGEAAIV
jgi:hypothetical protein